MTTGPCVQLSHDLGPFERRDLNVAAAALQTESSFPSTASGANNRGPSGSRAIDQLFESNGIHRTAARWIRLSTWLQSC